MKSLNPTLLIIIAIAIAGLSFYGGFKYRDQQFTKQRSGMMGQFQRGQSAGENSAGSINMRNGAGRPVTGEIVKIDDKSLTVKETDGSTKIVIFTDSTIINKTTDAVKGDLKIGMQIGVFGTTNSDGSILSQNIQLNPQFRMMGTGGTTPASSK
jgi:hypothetical protein